MLTIAGGIILAIVIIMAAPFLIAVAGVLLVLAAIVGVCIFLYLNPQLLIVAVGGLVLVAIFGVLAVFKDWVESKYPGRMERVGEVAQVWVDRIAITLISMTGLAIAVAIGATVLQRN